MRAGDTFWFSDREEHFWMVISDPEVDPSQVVIVNMTGWRRDKDQACLINPGDHPAVTKNSVVNYAESRVYSNAHLDDMDGRGTILVREPLSASILEMIRVGAAKTDRIPLGHKEILIVQELIEQ